MPLRNPWNEAETVVNQINTQQLLPGEFAIYFVRAQISPMEKFVHSSAAF